MYWTKWGQTRQCLNRARWFQQRETRGIKFSAKTTETEVLFNHSADPAKEEAVEEKEEDEGPETLEHFDPNPGKVKSLRQGMGIAKNSRFVRVFWNPSNVWLVLLKFYLSHGDAKLKKAK